MSYPNRFSTTVLRPFCQRFSRRRSRLSKGVKSVFLLSSFASRTFLVSTIHHSAIASAMSTTAVTNSASDFFVLARDRGTVRDDLPAWATKTDDPFQLNQKSSLGDSRTCTNDDSGADDAIDNGSCPSTTMPLERREVEGVPGAFQVLNVLSKEEAKSMGTFLASISRASCDDWKSCLFNNFSHMSVIAFYSRHL
jgi:hypothetical protein